MTRRIAILLTLVCVACKPDAPKPAAADAVPQVRATVVTIRTTVEPEKRTLTRTLVIAGGKARDTGELDVWRLYDVEGGRVTFVDDLARTVRTESLQSLARRKRAALASSLPAHYPRLRLNRTGETRAIAGATAERNVIAHGGYERELWLAEHPAIPPGLFALMLASERPTTPLAPMMRAVEDALLATRAFPLLDRSEIDLGENDIVIEQSVVGVTQRDVPRALLEVPRGYKDLTPRPAAAKKK